MLDFEEMVINHLKDAQNEYGQDGVKIVIMLTGAEALGQMIQQSIDRVGMKAEIKELVLTVNMCEQIGDIDTFKDWDKIEDGLKKYLLAENIIDEKTKHIIFIDTGFMGTINGYLERVFKNDTISKDYLTIANGFDFLSFNDNIPTGLNSYNTRKWEFSDDNFERLVRFAFIVDDGFEHALYSPAGFFEESKIKQYQTGRKWFHELVVSSMKNIPKQSGSSAKTPNEQFADYIVNLLSNALKLKPIQDRDDSIFISI
ncbi:MAG: hypothetical protein KJ915_01455 [Candidatus Omnitrophica bacterium]|nr:hypothetical protein [Candidatus Omnitrophota bacterium]